ncbi:RICIN domain-containing protein, partial [Ruminococcus sp. CAG:330]|uniref:RICIN domain-containing protein n=1 Tax=Ruminococcus sp. CAG:330 TaxID=1262954 RepID=UPI00263F86E7
DGDGYYTLYPQIGDKVSYLLDISGNSPDNGTNVGIWSATDADAQRFKFYQASDGIYYLLTKASGDQSCVAVQAASKDSGANVVQWAVNLSDTSQQWKLTQVSDTGCTMDTSKTYMFRNTNSGLYMEVANGKAEDNSNVQQWGANEPAAHNSWTLKEFGGGYYYIISQLADGKTYYLNSTGSANGANIEIVTNNKSSSHLFKFVKNPDGTYNILTRTSYDAAAVEVANADRNSGANVQQWTANGNACQKWEVQTCTTTTTATTTAKTTVTTATQADTTSAKPATTVVTTAATTAAESVPATTETVVSTTVAESATAEKTTSSSTSTTVQTTQTAETTESTLSAKVLYGDANLDGEIDLADAVFLNKAVAGVVSMNDTARANGDCNADGKIDSSDSMVLLKFLVHLVNALPQKSA